MAEETLPLPDIPSHFFVKTHKVVKRLDSAAYDKEFHSQIKKTFNKGVKRIEKDLQNHQAKQISKQSLKKIVKADHRVKKVGRRKFGRTLSRKEEMIANGFNLRRFVPKPIDNGKNTFAKQAERLINSDGSISQKGMQR